MKLCRFDQRLKQSNSGNGFVSCILVGEHPKMVALIQFSPCARQTILFFFLVSLTDLTQTLTGYWYVACILVVSALAD